ncbi:MAG: type VI secretion system transmembrane protein TssO [Dysgonamonadaceae bacterium]|jgi:hypothetical protein|nr:type VI secretion system transmembrane protein TssO [Dysgonamonadaceae bacterium]
MKPQNNKEIYQSYWEFSGYLAACVLVGVLIYFFYTQTVETEVNRIVDKTEEYDRIYVRQNELADRIDSLYLYAGMFNTNMNDALLMNAVSKRKQDIMSSIEDMNSRDVRMCQKLMSEVNTFLSIKDSIRMMKQEEDLVLNDLRKCIDDNKQTTRKLTIGGITLEK